MDVRGGLPVKALDVSTKRYIDVYIDQAGQRICVGQMWGWQKTCYGATQDAIAAFRLVAEHPFRVFVVRTRPDGIETFRYEYLAVLDAAGVYVFELWIDNVGRLRDQLGRLLEVENLALAQRAEGVMGTVLAAVGTVSQIDVGRLQIRLLAPPVEGAKAQYALYLAADLGVLGKETADQLVYFLQRYTAEIARLSKRIKELEAAVK